MARQWVSGAGLTSFALSESSANEAVYYGVAVSGTSGVASGAISGTAAITFGQSGAVTGSGTVAGSAAITFGQSAAVTGSGAVAGTAPVAFDASGAVSGTGAVAGSSAIAFDATGDVQAPSPGAFSGVAAVAFDAIGTLVGDGAVAGATAIAFGATASVSDANAVFLIGPSGGAGGPAPDRKRKKKGKSLDELLREVMDPPATVVVPPLVPVARSASRAPVPLMDLVPERSDVEQTRAAIERIRRIETEVAKLKAAAIERALEEDDEEALLLLA